MKKAIIYLAIFLGTCWVTSQLLQFVSDMLGDLGFSATLKDDAVWFFAPYAACLFVAFKCLSPNISPKPFLENKHKFAIAGYFLLLFAFRRTGWIHMGLCRYRRGDHRAAQCLHLYRKRASESFQKLSGEAGKQRRAYSIPGGACQ